MSSRLLPPLLIAAVLLAGAVIPSQPRVFQVIVFAAMLAALWEAGSRIARRLAPDFGPASHGVAAFSFAVGVAVVPATWLGQLGWLRPAPFLIWTAAAFLLSHLLPRPLMEVEETTETSPVHAETSSGVRIDTALLIMAALAVALVGLYDVWRLRWAPAGMHGYDDVSYHLSAVATWIRYGDVRMIRFSMGDPSTPFYPILGEMASWVLIAPFRDSDVAARWTQIFFAVFSFLAVIALARRLGLSRRSATFAAIAYAGIYHVFPVLSVCAGNDQSTSFFTLAGIDAALALARRPRPGLAAVTGTALGLLLATKYVGVLFAPAVLAALAVALWVERRREGAERPAARTLAGLAAVLAVAMALAGGYTYLRNAVTTGNPLFPAPVEVFGVELFPGWGGISIADRASAPEFQIHIWDFLTRRSRLFGSYFPFTLLPAAVLAPLLALRRRRWLAALTFALAPAFFLEFLFLMADHRDNRYFLPALALAAVALAWLLEEIGPRTSLAVRGVLLAWITVQAARHIGQSGAVNVLGGLVAVAAGWALARTWNGWEKTARIPRWGWIAVAGALLIAAVPLGWAVSTYQAEKYSGVPSALALERLAGPHGTRVAYAGLNKPYYFFGGRFQNDLQIVPRNREVESQFYRWGMPMEDPYDFVGTYQHWRRLLGRRGIEYVVIALSNVETPEWRWVTRRKDDFALVHQDPEVQIWRVVDESRE